MNIDHFRILEHLIFTNNTMSNISRVIHLQIKPARGAPMQPVTMVEAVTEQGLRNDLQFGRSKRQVLIIERETLEEFGLPIGNVRENITVEGIKLTGLPAGTRMQVGRALLEATMDCTPCRFIEAKRPGLREACRDVGARYSG